MLRQIDRASNSSFLGFALRASIVVADYKVESLSTSFRDLWYQCKMFASFILRRRSSSGLCVIPFITVQTGHPISTSEPSCAENIRLYGRWPRLENVVGLFGL